MGDDELARRGAFLYPSTVLIRLCFLFPTVSTRLFFPVEGALYHQKFSIHKNPSMVCTKKLVLFPHSYCVFFLVSAATDTASFLNPYLFRITQSVTFCLSIYDQHNREFLRLWIFFISFCPVLLGLFTPLAFYLFTSFGPHLVM